MLQSYTLTITAEKLVREQANTPTVTIEKSGVTAIIKHRDGSLLIKGEKPLDARIRPVMHQLESRCIINPGFNAVEIAFISPGLQAGANRNTLNRIGVSQTSRSH